MAYATVDEVVQRMGHSGATSTDLIANVTAAITAATEQIERDTGREFSTTTESRTFAIGDNLYVLEVDDFQSVSGLALDDDDDGVFEVVVAASGYELRKLVNKPGRPFDRIALLDRRFPTGGRHEYRIEVTATWGFAAAVPAPINQACSLMAARIAERTKLALFGVQSFGELGASAIRNTDPDYRNLIGPYIRPQVA